MGGDMPRRPGASNGFCRPCPTSKWGTLPILRTTLWLRVLRLCILLSSSLRPGECFRPLHCPIILLVSTERSWWARSTIISGGGQRVAIIPRPIMRS